MSKIIKSIIIKIDTDKKMVYGIRIDEDSNYIPKSEWSCGIGLHPHIEEQIYKVYDGEVIGFTEYWNPPPMKIITEHQQREYASYHADINFYRKPIEEHVTVLEQLKTKIIKFKSEVIDEETIQAVKKLGLTEDHTIRHRQRIAEMYVEKMIDGKNKLVALIETYRKYYRNITDYSRRIFCEENNIEPDEYFDYGENVFREFIEEVDEMVVEVKNMS